MSDDLYSSFDRRLDTVLGQRMGYFKLIRAMRLDFETQTTELEFDEWVLENYGLHVFRGDDDVIKFEHRVVDEQKYMLATLKYGI
jgi:hypothetical protein